MRYKQKLMHEPEMMHCYLSTESTHLNNFPIFHVTAWPS